MKEYRDEIEIDAPADSVYGVLADVIRWPTWTRSMTEVSLLPPGPLQVGQKVRIRQPRLPAATWTVDTVVPGRSFSWISSRAGITSTAEHQVLSLGQGCRVLVSLRQTGPFAPLSAALLGRLIRRYLRMEVVGLKLVTEQGATASS